MDNLGALLGLLTNQSTLKQLSKTVKAKPDQVKQLAEAALPTLIEAMTRNASTPQGAQSLSKALDQHQDDDLGDVMGFLKNVDTTDGSKIIGHLLGKKETTVTNKLASNTGLDGAQVASLMTQFGPLLLAFLGNQKKQTNTSSNDLGAGLSALLGGTQSNDLLSIASTFLDTDKDGDITDDLSNMLGSFLKRK